MPEGVHVPLFSFGGSRRLHRMLKHLVNTVRERERERERQRQRERFHSDPRQPQGLPLDEMIDPRWILFFATPQLFFGDMGFLPTKNACHWNSFNCGPSDPPSVARWPSARVTVHGGAGSPQAAAGATQIFAARLGLSGLGGCAYWAEGCRGHETCERL